MTDTGLPHLPGVATVSEILSAVEAEYTELKFLPTQAAGGANYLKSVRFTDLIGTLLPDRRNLHHNTAQYLALPNVGLHRFHRGRGSSWPADPGLRGDCRTRRCSNGVVTPRWRMVFSLAPWRAAASRACCSLRARSERVSAGVTTAVPARYRGGPGR